MGDVRSIKGIDEETWAEFKSLAAKNKMKLGEMFTIMVRDFAKKFWSR